ncbi:ATP-dependent helicase [Candidatus Saccharibacteria bacterium]|nr:ATP-dependent helicase [Candidatus Saccharibacteria bacterium]
MKFEEVYRRLNAEQREAVDEVEGPLLVLAGPGTGKTQLLSARVANILRETDALAENILCLTFTEAGARNMRERLAGFIGQDSYRVGISTYHGFGRELISEARDYFAGRELEKAADEIKIYGIVKGILDGLEYRDILRRAEVRDVISTISELKRELVSAEDLRRIVEQNREVATEVNGVLAEVMGGVKRMPSKLEQAVEIYGAVLEVLEKNLMREKIGRVGGIAEEYVFSLKRAFAEAEAEGKARALNAWKTKYLEKDLKDRPILKIEAGNRKMESMAGVLEKYAAALEAEGLFDYDDMILEAIRVLEENDDLRFTLQEKYLYIMLDEYQDTNAAQSRIIELLTNNPASEGRPNVMAVGDDDQAIYAFQGAMSSNLLEFYERYRDVKVVNLVKNYRSGVGILEFARGVAGQIEGRFGFSTFPPNGGVQKPEINSDFMDELPELKRGSLEMCKELVAESGVRAEIERVEFKSSIGENAWVAGRIAGLLKSGEEAREIAVIAPKHAYLEKLLPFLHEREVAVTYEKRENILEARAVRELVAFARLVLDPRDENWAEVLSFEFFGIDPMEIWKVSWKAASERRGWAEVVVESECEELVRAGKLVLDLSLKAKTETLEKMVDYMTGAEKLVVGEEDLTSPMRGFCLGRDARGVYEVLNYLTVLRDRLADFRGEEGRGLRDLIEYVEACETAGVKVMNTSPYNEAVDTVNLMTAYAAKGLEFKHVFVISADDKTWAGGKNRVNMVNLPVNLQKIRHVGDSQDDRLRLMYVAITRAKTNLYVTSSLWNYAGKALERLRFFDEREEGGVVRNHLLPDEFAVVRNGGDAGVVGVEELELNWRDRHVPVSVEMKDLLRERLEKYRISPTHLNSFVDVVYAGPRKFYENTILRFPQGISVSGVFGNCVHAALDWWQREVLKGGVVGVDGVLEVFERELAKAGGLNAGEKELLQERGEFALREFYKQRGEMMAMKNIRSEVNFGTEMIALGDVILTGKVDRMEIDEEKKEIIVVDFKTGPSRTKISRSDLKTHKYLQQVYLYKLLVENSVKFRGYEVVGARLEFVEADDEGVVNFLEIYEFDKEELERCEKLLRAVWGKVMAFDFPDVSEYSEDLAGVRKFEEELIVGLESA